MCCLRQFQTRRLLGGAGYEVRVADYVSRSLTVVDLGVFKVHLAKDLFDPVSDE